MIHDSKQRPTVVLLALVAASFAVRVVLLTRVHGPWIFPDELGYQQVAVNIARSRLALYNENGFSYPPLYPLVLSPLFALGLSAPAAYGWIKAANALLMSLALLPTYGIARFLLPRRPALLVAVLTAAAPLMYYTALGMSENLAFPLFCVAAWLLLRTLGQPSARNDLLFLAAAVAACGARIQLVAVLPAALTAPVLIAVARKRGIVRGVWAELNAHRVLVAGELAIAVGVIVPALLGHGTFSAAGRYSNVPGTASPSAVRLVKLFVYHASELVFATGVIPFVAAVAAAWVLVVRGSGARATAFAAAGIALTFWLLVETALATDSFERQGDAPRIHERYLFYLVPLFLTVLVVALRDERVRRSRTALPLGVAVALLGALAIPYQTVVNGTIVADTFGLQIFARNDTLQSIAHAAVLGVVVVIALGAVVVLLRAHPAAVLVVLILVFVYGSERLGKRIDAASRGAHSFFTSSRYDWVDRTHPATNVALVTGPAVTDPVAEWHTAYYNLTIDRLYYTCRRTLSPDFGERRVSMARTGTLLVAGTPLRTRYAVVPSDLGVAGRVLARDRVAAESLVAPAGGVLRIDAAHRAAWRCQAPS